jgi:hypothetical protein
MKGRRLNPDPVFKVAVLLAAKHDENKLLVYMIEEKGFPKSDDDRLLLAAYHRGDFKNGPGHPADEAVATAAELYPIIMRELRRLPQTVGVRVRRGQLQKAAIAATTDFMREYHDLVIEPNKLMNKVRRSTKKRRSKKPRIKR